VRLDEWRELERLPAFGDLFVKTNFEAVTYGSNQFVAVGDHGITAVSENGTNWETHATPTPYNLTGVACRCHKFIRHRAAPVTVAVRKHWPSHAPRQTRPFVAHP
jgi:hypothetical protein